MVHDFLSSATVELTYVVSNEMSQQLLGEYITVYTEFYVSFRINCKYKVFGPICGVI